METVRAELVDVAGKVIVPCVDDLDAAVGVATYALVEATGAASHCCGAVSSCAAPEVTVLAAGDDASPKPYRGVGFREVPPPASGDDPPPYNDGAAGAPVFEVLALRRIANHS
jgi:hypothetical protein